MYIVSNIDTKKKEKSLNEYFVSSSLYFYCLARSVKSRVFSFIAVFVLGEFESLAALRILVKTLFFNRINFSASNCVINGCLPKIYIDYYYVFPQ